MEHFGVEAGNCHVLNIGTAMETFEGYQLWKKLLVDLQQKENVVRVLFLLHNDAMLELNSL